MKRYGWSSNSANFSRIRSTLRPRPETCYERVSRFPTVEEDVPPLYLLTVDYRRWLARFYAEDI